MSSPDFAQTSPLLLEVPGISPEVIAAADRHRDAFLNAWPFKHAAMDDFFEPSFAERLLEEFPHFDPKLARNEMGEIGGKAVNTKIREISPAYRELYELIGGKPFLELMSRITGIPDLILDPRMYGGGTHENLHGQELDPHVDFNYDEAQKLHRRLNVIVYMNKGWQPEWGGAIEIHSNPRDPEHNRIRAFDPIFNRCVMFETNEISWHGFPKIDLPPDERGRSRKSISIYLYTATRPAEEIAPMHGTFYVQRPLPERFREGLTLAADDVKEIKELLWRRDIWVAHYQKLELEKNREIDEKNSGIRAMMESHDAEIANAKAALAAMEDEHRRQQEALQSLVREGEALSEPLEFMRRNVRVPITGYAVQTRMIAGVHADLWMSKRAEFEIRPVVRVSGVRLEGWRPENSPPGTARIIVNEASAGQDSANPDSARPGAAVHSSAGQASAEMRVGSGRFTVELRLPTPLREPFRVTIECDPVPQMGVDSRELGYRLIELKMLHPLLPLLAKAR